MGCRAYLELDTSQSAIMAFKGSETFSTGDIPQDHLAISAGADLKPGELIKSQ